MSNWKPVETPSLLRWLKKNTGKSIVTFTIEGDDGLYFHEW